MKQLTTRAVVPQQVAIMPIPEQVLFPGFPQPFPVFEGRYMAMLADLVKVRPEERWVAVPQMRSAYGNHYRGRPAFHAITTIGRVVGARQMGEGHAEMTVMGVTRVQLVEVQSQHPYRMASCEVVSDIEQPPERVRTEVERLIQASVDLMTTLGPLAEGLEGLLRDREDPQALVYRLASVLIHEPERRRALLEDLSLPRRVDTILDAMTDLMSMAAMASIARNGEVAA